MNTNIQWSHDLRINLYKALTETFGPFNSINFDQNGKPYGMSKKEYLSELEWIGFLMGLGKDKGGALSNQISWAFRTPRSYAHEGHWSNHEKNKSAAEEAGYFVKSYTTSAQSDEEKLSPFAWFMVWLKSLLGIK